VEERRDDAALHEGDRLDDADDCCDEQAAGPDDAHDLHLVSAGFRRRIERGFHRRNQMALAGRLRVAIGADDKTVRVLKMRHVAAIRRTVKPGIVTAQAFHRCGWLGFLRAGEDVYLRLHGLHSFRLVQRGE